MEIPEIETNSQCNKCGYRCLVDFIHDQRMNGNVVCKRCYSEFISKHCGEMVFDGHDEFKKAMDKRKIKKEVDDED